MTVLVTEKTQFAKISLKAVKKQQQQQKKQTNMLGVHSLVYIAMTNSKIILSIINIILIYFI